MRRLAYCVAALALTGCATPAPTAPQAALEARTAAVKSCLAKPRTTYRAHTECLLAADGAFFTALRVNNPALVARYAARMRQLAAEADASGMDQDRYAARMLAIKASFISLPAI